jgi:succinate-semialdehyde dehydrogenase / glutarate-semialdehyde dehydrogenase
MYINKFTESTPEVPFGGAKNSGYGRELASFGPRSFVNAKTVWIA